MSYQVEILNAGPNLPDRMPREPNSWYADKHTARFVADVIYDILGPKVGPVIVTSAHGGAPVYRAGPPVEREFPGGEFAPEEAEHVW